MLLETLLDKLSRFENHFPKRKMMLHLQFNDSEVNDTKHIQWKLISTAPDVANATLSSSILEQGCIGNDGFSFTYVEQFVALLRSWLMKMLIVTSEKREVRSSVFRSITQIELSLLRNLPKAINFRINVETTLCGVFEYTSEDFIPDRIHTMCDISNFRSANINCSTNTENEAGRTSAGHSVTSDYSNHSGAASLENLIYYSLASFPTTRNGSLCFMLDWDAVKRHTFQSQNVLSAVYASPSFTLNQILKPTGFVLADGDVNKTYILTLSDGTVFDAQERFMSFPCWIASNFESLMYLLEHAQFPPVICKKDHTETHKALRLMSKYIRNLLFRTGKASYFLANATELLNTNDRDKYIQCDAAIYSFLCSLLF